MKNVILNNFFISLDKKLKIVMTYLLLALRHTLGETPNTYIRQCILFHVKQKKTTMIDD